MSAFAINNPDLPAISTGIYGYVKEKATPVAIDAVLEFLKKRPKTLEEVVFMAFDDNYSNLYKGLLDKKFPNN